VLYELKGFRMNKILFEIFRTKVRYLTRVRPKFIQSYD